MPTSLTYVILSARGFSPWRPAADMGTTLHEIYTPLFQIFKGQRKRFGWHKTCATFSGRYPYLRANRFQGSHFSLKPLNKKRQLSPKLAPTSLDSIVLPHKQRSKPREGPNTALSVAKCGNINPLPFRSQGDTVQTLSHFRTELTYRLGSTDPCSTAVHMETFSTSAFKVLI